MSREISSKEIPCEMYFFDLEKRLFFKDKEGKVEIVKNPPKIIFEDELWKPKKRRER